MDKFDVTTMEPRKLGALWHMFSGVRPFSPELAGMSEQDRGALAEAVGVEMHRRIAVESA